MFRTKLRKILPYINRTIFDREKKDNEQEDAEQHATRYKPEGLDSLCQSTKFSRKELQILYRGFKQECPAGIVNEDTFKDIYAQFFPQGDSTAYAHYVFNAFDQDHSGSISFEEFVTGLSVLSRGSLHEKLTWAFCLYDINGDGIITKDEMLDIVSAIYDLMGKFADPCITDRTARDHVEKVFQVQSRFKFSFNHDRSVTKNQTRRSASASPPPEHASCGVQRRVENNMDRDGDGVINIEEFMERCRTDETISKSIAMFDTVL